jgi:tRNA(adenine34) deaminase
MTTRSSTKAKPAKKKSSANRRWVKTVTTDFTHPPKDLFTQSAPVIARALASKKVSPKGPGSGTRMLTYFINRAGKGLTATRKRELERAKMLLHERIQKEKEESRLTIARSAPRR